jgi:hypothetical protein
VAALANVLLVVAACTSSAATPSPGGTSAPTVSAAATGAAVESPAGAASTAPAKASVAPSVAHAASASPAPSSAIALASLHVFVSPLIHLIRGQWLLYNDDVRVVKADGTGARKLADGYPIAWSHDGSKVYYQARVTDPAHCEPVLKSASIDTSAVTTIVTMHPGDEDFTWSPDDTKIAFFREVNTPECGWQNQPDPRVSLMVMNADGTGLRTVISILPQYGPIYWSPDSAYLYVWRVDWRDGSDAVPGPIIKVRVSDGSTSTVMSSRLYGDFAVSPDGTKIAATVWRPGEAGDYLYLANTSGAGLHDASDGSSFYTGLVWSRGSNALAALREPHDTHGFGPAYLVVVNPWTATAHDTYGTMPANGDQHPSWGPSDTHLVCNAHGITVLNADGTAPHSFVATNWDTVRWQP